MPIRLKHQPGPMASIINCNTAVPPAARAHRTILAAAAAVDELFGWTSVNRVPRLFKSVSEYYHFMEAMERPTVNIEVIVAPHIV